MKLSLSWVFDHIAKTSYKQLDVEKLFEQFNETTAELDYARKINFDLESMALAQVTGNTEEQTFLYVPEWHKEIKIPAQSNATIDDIVFVKNENKQYRFATLRDFHGEKDSALPPISCAAEMITGDWKKTCEETDYVFCIDNKSIGHRPDLWGHRGIAREMAALLNLEMIPEDHFIKPCIIKNYEKRAQPSLVNPVVPEIKSPALCTRLAGMYINDIKNIPSLPFIAQRLARIDARPIDALVDAANYVMYDIGHPIHTFDARFFSDSPALIAESAQEGEKLRLLDGEEIILSATDCIISNGKKTLSLAGVMGGIESGVTKDTASIVVEAAHFNASSIRHTSLRHKTRTEASSRFEKGLDPNQNTFALMRFLALLSSWEITYRPIDEIVSVGVLAQEHTICIKQEYILEKIGLSSTTEHITQILKHLGLGVRYLIEPKEFHLVIPTFRDDLKIKEDIVEEVVRFLGYSNIPHQLPVRALQPVDNSTAMRVRSLKNHCAFGLEMHEVVHYNLYDEAFLKSLRWDPVDTADLANPHSQNAYRPVTSLIPHLLKDIEANNQEAHPLQFFEWGKVWHQKNDVIHEKKALGLLWHHPTEKLDFYDIKARLESLFQLIGAPVLWQSLDKNDNNNAALYHPHEAAQLICDNVTVGRAGIINPLIFKNISSTGDAFIAEIDGEFLTSYAKPTTRAGMPTKYPKVSLDLCVLAPVTVTVAELEEAIASCDGRIRDVILVDYYQKPEWLDQRSVTLRYEMYDDYKTMEKHEIDEVTQSVIKAVEPFKVVLR